MKIGILTIFRTGNYGGTLQAYALQQAIARNNLGDADIINYTCDSVKGKIDWRFFRNVGLFRTLVAFVEKLYYSPRIKKVYGFVDSYVNTEELTKSDLPFLNTKYDVFLSGSDQIWNPDIQQGDYAYLLDFVSDDSKKRSYASSFGTEKIAQQHLGKYKSLLASYARITVREHSGANLVKEMIDINADVVLDPVFLLTPAQWYSILPEPVSKKDYVFAYQMAHSSLISKVIQKAQKDGFPSAIFVPFPIGGWCKFKPVLNFSSLEWVRAIHDAKFVVSDSFHAIVFSIIFKKQFYYIITSDTVKNRISRLLTILETLGLEDRIVDRVDQCDFSKCIDYDTVHLKLDIERERSLAILKELVTK